MVAWRDWQRAEQRATGIASARWMFTDGRGEPIHPHAISPDVRGHRPPRGYRSSDCTTCVTPTARCSSQKAPVKVVTERLGHAAPAFTIETYQHVLPGMQAEAARIFVRLIVPSSEKSEKTREKRRKKTA